MQAKLQHMGCDHGHAAALRHAQLPHQHGAGVGDRAECAIDLRAAQHHQAIGGAPQVQRLGTAGDGARQQVFRNGDEVALRAGLHLEVALDVAWQPEHGGGLEFYDRTAQGRGAAPRLDQEQMRAPDLVLLDHPVPRGEPTGKAFRMQRRTGLLNEAGRAGSGHGAMDLRQSVAHIRRKSTEVVQSLPGSVQSLVGTARLVSSRRTPSKATDEIALGGEHGFISHTPGSGIWPRSQALPVFRRSSRPWRRVRSRSATRCRAPGRTPAAPR